MAAGTVGRARDLGLVRALLADRAARVVLVTGEAGVGKSHLLDVLAQERAAVRAWGVRGLSAVPLGALAHLVVTGESLTEMVVEVLAAVPAGGVLVVDDLDQLDEVSLAVALRVARDRDRVLLASVRTEGGELPAAVAAASYDGGVAVHEVRAFDPAETEQFVEQLLGDVVDAAVVDEVWRRCRGNALLVSQLVGEARLRGDLVRGDAGWVARGRLRVPAEPRRLLLSRLDGLSDEAVEAAHLLAVVERMPLAEVTLSGRGDWFDELEEHGLVEWVGDVVRFAHPLLAEVVWDDLTPPRRQALHRDHAALARAVPGYDVVRAAVLALEAGEVPDEPGLLAAARLAMAGGSARTAVRLALGAVDAADLDVAAEAALVAATAQAELGRLDDAVDLLRRVLVQQPIGPMAAALAVALHSLVVWTSFDVEGAAEVLAAEIERYPAGTPLIGEVFAVARADALVYAGHAEQALALVADVDGAQLPPDLRYFHLGTLTHAHTRLGRTAEAIAVAESALAGAAADPDGVDATVRVKHLTNLANAQREHGRLTDAAASAEQAHRIALADGRVLERAWAALNAGAAHLQTGDLTSATTWARRSLLAAAPAAMVDCQRLALGVLITAQGMCGVADDASLRRLDELPDGVGFLRQHVPIARAWHAVARGRTGLAHEHLASGLRDAADSGAVVTEGWILHEQLRLGERAGVLDRLRALPADSPVARARVALATGIERRDAAALADAAARFEDLGALLYAAEAHAELGRTSTGRDAARAVRRARELVDRLGCVPRTPLLLGVPEDPLTRRERLVAERAATGQSNAEIAADLHLSVRTVENHLARAYAKLGIESRSELAGAVRPAHV
ncbi:MULTISPECIES: LuxR C-terminal-related transcriptional regulator [unclassified Nocardioides]|uniref:LuxR C-terminal-related transcriptional regulator n=1 Tax=unclassified Nocardioides TaxID=2615069 RepID=UPI0030147266